MQIRPTKACINLSNLAHNYQTIRAFTKNKKVIAVVKADAYGHGAKKVVEKLNKLDYPPIMYAVATVEEAIDLRRSNRDKDILVFEPFSPSMVEAIKKYRFIVTITSMEQLEFLELLGLEFDVNYHIVIDTGMGRLGIKHYQIDELINLLKKIKIDSIKGLYTHFATSDEDERSFTELQFKRFDTVIAKIKAAGIDPGLIHAANSGGVFDHPSTQYGAVRAGIALYGFYKNRAKSIELGLKPVMSLISELGTVERARAGESISYGRKYILSRDAWIGTIPVGYADGVRRALLNRLSFLIEGKLYPQVGTITMDRLMVDLGEDKLLPGCKVVLLSNINDSGCDCWNWCEILDTIPYEITVGVSRRVPRVYRENANGFC